MDDLLEWFGEQAHLLQVVGILSLLTFAASLVLIPMVVARIRPDYFATTEAPPTRWHQWSPPLWLTVVILKNLFGVVLLILGVAMLVLPGQGLLTILAALVLLDFPGKRRLELALVRDPRILRALNWMRRKAGRGPFETPISAKDSRP